MKKSSCLTYESLLDKAKKLPPSEFVDEALHGIAMETVIKICRALKTSNDALRASEVYREYCEQYDRVRPDSRSNDGSVVRGILRFGEISTISDGYNRREFAV